MDAKTYAGPRGCARPEQLAELERRGWIAEEKSDGCYVTAYVGRDGRIVTARYRSGGVVGREAGRDLYRISTPIAPGTVLVGELQVQTPAAHRWQDVHGGLRGLVVFDVLAWGDVHAQFENLCARGRVLGPGSAMPARDMTTATQAERRAVLERLIGGLEGAAARVLQLVPQRRRGLRAWYERVIGEGGEGVVVKDPRAPLGRGARKVKRLDTVTAQVLQVLPEQGRVQLFWGGRAFSVSIPKIPLRVGQLVDIFFSGLYESDLPRHARIVRARNDLSPTVTG